MANQATAPEMQERFAALCAELRLSGLRVLHSGAAEPAWNVVGRSAKSALIIGHGGSEFWPFFQASAEFGDGAPDPLDRWSRRVIGAAAPDMTFVSPNDGPPFPPIHALSMGGALSPSPLGMLVHSTFGLWSAVRGLLFTEALLPLSPPAAAPEPSVFADCFADCFSACPVAAFSDTGFDAAACAGHLSADPVAPCWGGCLARKACTLGAEFAYHSSHAKFYMDAFTKAMARRGHD